MDTKPKTIYKPRKRRRNQVEQALHQSEQNFTKAFRSSPAALMITRLADGLYMELNEAYSAVVGYGREELIGHKTIEFNIFINASDHQAIVERLLATGSTRDFETTIRHRTGVIRHVVAAQELIKFNGEDCILTHLLDITERKHAERSLQESEERLRLSLQAADQGLYDLNVQTGDAIVNKEYAEMLGYDPKTFVETNARWIERLHPDDQESIAKAYQDYVSGLLPEYRIEFRQRTRDGNWKWILSLGKVLEYDSEGKPLRMLGTHTDITERKRAEEALRASEERYRNLVENMNDIVMEVDTDGNYTYLSPNYATLSGYSVADELRESALTHIHPDDIPLVVQKLEQAFHSGRQSATYRVQKKNGEWRWLETMGQPFRASDGSIHLIAVARDITERKRAEEALKRSEQVLRLFVEHSPAFIAMFDREMNYIAASRRYLIDYRLGEQDLTGRSHYEILPEIPNRWKEIHQRCLQGAVEKADEDPFIREDGTTDWVRWEMRPWYEDSGKIGGIIPFSEVVTQYKQAQDQLRLLNLELEQRVMERTMEISQANRAKDEFLANMSHELRTPLNTVLGLSESLLEQRRGPLNEKQIQSIQLIASSGQHLLRLINDILEVSKIEAGKLQLHPAEISVKDVCESSLSFIREFAIQRLISVDFTNDESASTLYADPQRLKQILINLLTNAVKFTPERGRVSLDVYANAEKDQISFAVSDTGIGIAHEDLKKLFTPFIQLDSSLSRQYAGTGLGLALVQKLTDMHGGSVFVESEVGKGSRFIVALPLNHNNHEPPSSKGREPLVHQRQDTTRRSTSKAKEMILLAEDNEITAGMVKEYLELEGYRVVLAGDGEEALEKAKETPPIIILMDIQMPRMDGLNAMVHLRKDPRFASTPIVALTALAMPGDKERCLRAGANAYLSKPVSLSVLLRAIQSLTGERS